MLDATKIQPGDRVRLLPDPSADRLIEKLGVVQRVTHHEDWTCVVIRWSGALLDDYYRSDRECLELVET